MVKAVAARRYPSEPPTPPKAPEKDTEAQQPSKSPPTLAEMEVRLAQLREEAYDCSSHIKRLKSWGCYEDADQERQKLRPLDKQIFKLKIEVEERRERERQEAQKAAYESALIRQQQQDVDHNRRRPGPMKPK